MFGEADFEVFDAFSMEEIARIVNHYHPGKGKFVMIPGTDHGMIEVGSMAKGLELRNKPEYRDYYNKRFNYKIVTEIDQWDPIGAQNGLSCCGEMHTKTPIGTFSAPKE